MRKNPTTKDAFYPDDAFLAFHAMLGEAGQRAFHIVWEDGRLLSLRARGGGRRRQIFEEDVIAGDDNYIFFSLGIPREVTGSEGFIFGFDPYDLLDLPQQTFVGVRDLNECYMNAREQVVDELILDGYVSRNMIDTDYLSWAKKYKKFPILADDFKERALEIQERTRLEGEDAEMWLHWLADDGEASMKEIEGIAYRAASVMRPYTDPHSPDPMSLLENREDGLKGSELLVSREVDLELAVTINYAGMFFSMEDFIGLVGVRPGQKFTAPRNANNYVLRRPYRCPACGDPAAKGSTLREVFASAASLQSGPRSFRCASCGRIITENFDDVLVWEK